MNSLRQWVGLVTLALLLISTAALRAEAPDDKTSPGDSAEATALAKIAPRMQQFIDETQIAGAVTLVMRHGQIVHFEAVGSADIAKKRPMTSRLFVRDRVDDEADHRHRDADPAR